MPWPPWSKIALKDLACYVAPDAAMSAAALQLPFNRHDLEQQPAGRRQIVAALYSALATRQPPIQYDLEKLHLDDHAQIIRTPQQILHSPGQGTCLDLALLFCGLCLSQELLPLLIMLEGHALMAVSLRHGAREWEAFNRTEKIHFADDAGLCRKVTVLRELVRDGAYLAVECTGFAHNAAQGLLSFEQAVEAGAQRLQRGALRFQAALDIQQLHANGKTPYTPDDPQPTTPYRLVGVPARRPHFLGRDQLQAQLVQVLSQNPPPTVALVGQAGVGKSTLAVALANDPQLQRRYPDGILWAGLGPQPDVPSRLAAWGDALGIDVSDKATPQSRGQAIKDAIGVRRLLLIIDDAWAPSDSPGQPAATAELLRCGGPYSGYLLTTRDAALGRAFAGASACYPVPPLEPPLPPWAGLPLSRLTASRRLPPRIDRRFGRPLMKDMSLNGEPEP